MADDKNVEIKYYRASEETPASTAAPDARLATLTQERDALQGQVDSHAAEKQQWEQDKATLTQERDAAKQAVKDGKLLPTREEGIKLISTVPRVSDEMAGKIYDLLTGQPQG